MDSSVGSVLDRDAMSLDDDDDIPRIATPLTIASVLVVNPPEDGVATDLAAANRGLVFRATDGW